MAYLIRMPGRMVDIRLAAGQALVFANGIVAHDRTGFSFEPEAPREVHRLLLGA